MVGEIPRQRKNLIQLNSASLGATLYVPATRPDLLTIATGQKYPELRSVVFDLEDAVLERDVEFALTNLQAMLRQLAHAGRVPTSAPLLFVRPRHAEMLSRIMSMYGIGLLNGFVLPKATAEVMPGYISSLINPAHFIMPTIETREAFDPTEMRRLREQLIAIQDRVLAIRIGGNDLLQTLGCRRSLSRTAYDGPLGNIVSSLISAFVPWGFSMSAPVLENFSNVDLLQSEIDQDIEHGLMTKTAIHPDQVGMIQHAYMVAEREYEGALRVLDESAPAVFAVDGVMLEPATHRGWAKAVIERASYFGIRPTQTTPLALVG